MRTNSRAETGASNLRNLFISANTPLTRSLRVPSTAVHTPLHNRHYTAAAKALQNPVSQRLFGQLLRAGRRKITRRKNWGSNTNEDAREREHDIPAVSSLAVHLRQVSPMRSGS